MRKSKKVCVHATLQQHEKIPSAKQEKKRVGGGIRISSGWRLIGESHVEGF
jgi:hypothetical protein